MIVSRDVSLVSEKRIVTGLIVSSAFAKKIHPVLQLDYFMNSYLKTIAHWCIAFYEEHGKSPNNHIKDIYETESCNLKETDSELIGTLLTTLDEQYDPENINVDYLKETALEYFRKRELEITVNNVSVLKETGDYDAAEKEIDGFKKITLDLDAGYLVNLGDVDQVMEIYDERDKEDAGFFQLPGDLGRYLGNSKRGDVIGYFAKAKLGKSFCLVDNFKHAVIQKKKTVFWSIEMTRTEITPRIMKSFTPMAGEGGLYYYPVFDCIKNQTGDCGDRESPVVVLDGEDLIQDPSHIPCTKCMGHLHGDREYKMTTYKQSIQRQADDKFTVKSALNGGERAPGIKSLLNKYGRLSVHPKYTLTYDKMMRDLEVFYAQDGFIPDIFILDYIDILGIGTDFDDYRAVDEAWKLLARMAGEFNALVITATQANKEGHTTDVLDSTHQGGFYGKNRHVNEMIGINQTATEKERGVLRYGITEARSQPFIPGKTCAVLQSLDSGSAYLDSYYPF